MNMISAVLAGIIFVGFCMVTGLPVIAGFGAAVFVGFIVGK